MQESRETYWNEQFGRRAVKLLPGEYFACKCSEMVVTVLGSCIAACIQDNKTKIGGMNHFMLPQSGRYEDRKGAVNVFADSHSARYGNVAMELLINEIIKQGGSRENMTAKIFGGAHVAKLPTNVGGDNIRFVREYLEVEGIRIVSEDVGGTQARRVCFIPSTNDVFVKKLGIEKQDEIAIREHEYKTGLDSQGGEENIYYLDDEL